jgi:hypothetical protein
VRRGDVRKGQRGDVILGSGERGQEVENDAVETTEGTCWDLMMWVKLFKGSSRRQRSIEKNSRSLGRTFAGRDSLYELFSIDAMLNPDLAM